MRPGQQQQNKQRMRGRGRKGPNPLSRSYESNGPDVKIRGTAQHIAEKYSTLARDASAAGDRVMAENYLQHAEHYGRIVAAAQGTFQLQRDDRDGEFGDDEGDDEILEDGGYTNGNGVGPHQPDVPQPQPQLQPQPQPQMRDNRDRENRDRDNRDRGNRDFNREARDNTRDTRDGAREPVRDGNRDNRDAYREGNRDPNRDPRDGQRDFNRDGNRDPRDNRGNRNRDGNRDFNREGRDHRNPPAQPTGLGPQPFVNGPVAPVPVAAAPVAPVPQSHVNELRRDETLALPAVRPDEGRFEEVVPNETRTENQPRRRGRPRRVRMADGETRNAPASAVNEHPGAEAGVRAEAPATDTPPPVPAEQPAAPASTTPALTAPANVSTEATSTAAAAEAPVKRRPGRPRKKKPEDDADPEGGDHLPAFLMASNS